MPPNPHIGAENDLKGLRFAIFNHKQYLRESLTLCTCFMYILFMYRCYLSLLYLILFVIVFVIIPICTYYHRLHATFHLGPQLFFEKRDKFELTVHPDREKEFTPTFPQKYIVNPQGNSLPFPQYILVRDIFLKDEIIDVTLR